MSRFPTARRSAVAALALVLLAAGLAGCRVARAGAPCATSELGQDVDWVLACRGGRWTRVITKHDAAVALKRVIDAQRATVPTEVQGATTVPGPPPGPTVVSTDTGVGFGCRLLSDRTVECWGRNVDGQLGDGTTVDRAAPAKVAGIATATALSVGSNHACAVLAGGAIACWGNGYWGQLGNGTASRSTPVLASGVAGAVGVAAGFAHTCAVLAGGAVRCWGSDSDGQTDGGSVTNALALAAGDDHTCALVAGGTVRCWGNDAFGQLGDGRTANRSTPVAVAGIGDATGVEAGGYRTCVTRASGATTCFGES
jgi:hypothetical protein